VGLGVELVGGVGVGVARSLLQTARRGADMTRLVAQEATRQLPRLTRLERLGSSTRISVGLLLDEQAKDSPDAVAFLFGDRAYTQAAVKERIDNVVRGLLSLGVRHGELVGVLMRTRPSALVIVAALNRLGAVVIFLAVLNLGPWRETLVFGQINILLLGLMTADLLSRSRRWRNGFPGSGFLVGVAAGIKLTPLVFGLYFLVRKDWRGLLNMAAGFAFTVLLGWVLRPAESLSFWFAILPDTSRIGGAGYVDNLSIKGALLHFGVPSDAVNAPWMLLSLLAVGLGAAVIRTASSQGARVVAISATALTMLLISPVSWSHHWVWMAAVLPAFAWTLRETPHRHRVSRGVMGAVLGLSTVVFLFSPKAIGTALGAENLDLQTPVPWIMASSAGVFCALAIMVCWLVVLRRDAVTELAE
jgi:alpha-1,2-mannosyltransferase